MVHTQPTKPSSKALGKRPMRNGVIAPSPLSLFTPSAANSPAADEETDDPSTSTSVAAAIDGAGAGPSGVGTSTRNNHKRVLPSRVRRGGVYSLVGTSDTDQNILDMLRRRGENEPLIPTHTVFILTTDSSQVPSASTSEIGLNKLANERYFERPEVIRAYKNQQDIQVPEFIQMDEETVGGRLRTRTEEEPPELTDATYEKRHRKYEMIEKRQRLREKEKLQHEHYKLKERIEQLRTMDYNAFLTLPDELFAEVENEGAMGLDYADGAPEPNTGGSSTGGGGTGSAASLLQEAERRRKLILDVAASLEERYRTLLPTERRPAEQLRFVTRVSSIEPSIPDENVEAISTTTEAERDVAAAAASSTVTSRSKPLKLKLRAQQTAQLTPPPTAASEPVRRRRETPIRSGSSPAPLDTESREDSTGAAPSRPMSRQRRSKVEERPTTQQLTPPTSNGQEQRPEDVVPDSLSLPSRTPDITTDDITQESQKYRPGGAATLTVHHEGMVPTSITKESPPPVTSNSKRRRRAMGQVQVNRNFNVIQYKVPQEQEPSRKTTKIFPSGYDAPPNTQATQQVTDTNTRERLTTGIDCSTTAASKDTRHTEHSTTKSHSHLPPTDSTEPETFVEAFGRFLSLSTKDMRSYLADHPRSIPYAQLRQLEKPDQGGEFDINVDVDVISTEQPDVDETPTADEPVTPPPESVGVPTSRSPELLLANSNSKHRRSRYWTPSVDVDVDGDIDDDDGVSGGVSKAGHRKRRSKTPLAANANANLRFGSIHSHSHSQSTSDRHPSSPPLTITSLQSYELNSPDGGGSGSGSGTSRKRPTKPINALLASSRHNEEPGRKTGRNVKAFGVEVPSFEGEEEFELPRWMVREVLNERRWSGGGGGDIGEEEDGVYEEDLDADADADGEAETVSDGDPPSFAVGMVHGEALHGSFVDSVSAVGRSRASRR